MAHRDLPLTMEYIQTKHEVTSLQKQVAEWWRKLEVATLASSKRP